MSQNPLKLKRLHHVEFWVGNAKQAQFYYNKAFGFSRFAYAGLETGNRTQASYAMRQGHATMVVSTPLGPDDGVNDHLRRHGDGVRDMAFEVENCDLAYSEAMARGAVSAVEPHDLTDDAGTVRHAAIHTYGDTIHSFLENKSYKGPFLPGYRASEVGAQNTGILKIDHIVGNVEMGRMEEWATFYENVMGFERFMQFDDDQISTEYSALMSIVMSNDGASIKFPINEPAKGKRKSQIEEYIDFYNGAGVQHIALLTKDIRATVTKLRANGVDFLQVPDTYYDTLTDRVGPIDEDIEELKQLRILVDRDDEGYLLQLFSNPVEDRPTLFYEIIQRKGSRGFGEGNFKALFESIEREQAQRGNL